MKICFVLNEIKTEYCGTSVIIIRKVLQRSHQGYVTEVGHFSFSNKDGLALRCKKIPKNLNCKTVGEFWIQVQDNRLKPEVVSAKEMDIIFLRNNPTEEGSNRQWAPQTAPTFSNTIKKAE